MDYKTPNQLADEFGKSLKTIYNRITKYKDKIRIKKEFGKTFVNYNDFTKCFQNRLTNYKNITKKMPQTESKTDFVKKETDFVNLQKNYNYSLQKIENLEKHNTTLSTQVKEYGLLFTEEKKEKKALQTRLDTLTQTLHQKIESFATQRIRLERKFYILLSFFVMICLFLLRFLRPKIQDIVMKQPSIEAEPILNYTPI